MRAHITLQTTENAATAAAAAREGMSDAHVLMPPALAATMPALYETGFEEDPLVRVKLFCPWNSWTWYAVEYDPQDRRCFGLVDGHYAEMGYFLISELTELRGPGGLRIERDLYFKPCPLSEVKGK